MYICVCMGDTHFWFPFHRCSKSLLFVPPVCVSSIIIITILYRHSSICEYWLENHYRYHIVDDVGDDDGHTVDWNKETQQNQQLLSCGKLKLFLVQDLLFVFKVIAFSPLPKQQYLHIIIIIIYTISIGNTLFPACRPSFMNKASKIYC